MDTIKFNLSMLSRKMADSFWNTLYTYTLKREMGQEGIFLIKVQYVAYVTWPAYITAS
jgi:preprotein translocase subunit SecB